MHQKTGAFVSVSETQEVITLPQGPAEVSNLWYARARLGVANLACYIWGAGIGASGKWITLCSRVLEKPAEYSVACLWKILSMIDLSATSTLSFWSDTGPHFRAYKVLATQGCKITEKYKVNVIVNFGAEHHMKHMCDGYFANLNHTLRQKTAEQMVATVSDLVQVYKEAYEATTQWAGGGLAEQTFVEWFPPEKKETVCVNFTVMSQRPGIKTCHCWEFKVLRRDRVNYFGRGTAAAHKATNIRGYCRMLSGRSSATDFSFVPVIATAAEPDEAVQDSIFLFSLSCFTHRAIVFCRPFLKGARASRGII